VLTTADRAFMLGAGVDRFMNETQRLAYL